MTSILLISDNPLFIQRAYESLERVDQVVLHAALHASGIFEAYLQHHPSIIVLDQTFLLPITSILKHFAKYQWECAFIVVGETAGPFDEYPNVAFAASVGQIPNAVQALSTRQTAPAAWPAPLPLTELQESDPLQPDIYYLMLSLCTDPAAPALEPDDMTRLRSQISTIGTPTILMPFQKDLLIVMKKSTMRMHGAFRQIHTMICKSFGQHYATISGEDLALDRLDGTLEQMLRRAPLRGFFSSCCYDLEQIGQMEQDRPALAVYPVFTRLLQALLGRRPDVLQSTLRDWYLTAMKPNLQLQSLYLTRDWQRFFDQTLLQKYAAPLPETPDYGTIENEYRIVAQHWRDIDQAYAAAPLLPVVRQSILLLLQEYGDPELSLAGLARKLGFSKAYISRVFSAQTRMTVVDFLQRLRMEYARDLLRVTARPIKEIASMVGYTDSQYFSKLFHRHTGFYPTDYRALLSQEE